MWGEREERIETERGDIKGGTDGGARQGERGRGKKREKESLSSMAIKAGQWAFKSGEIL